jgi:hypothetical protein
LARSSHWTSTPPIDCDQHNDLNWFKQAYVIGLRVVLLIEPMPIYLHQHLRSALSSRPSSHPR